VSAPDASALEATVAAGRGSRLEQLAEAYALAKPAADAAKEHLDAITDAIKLELTMAAPGAHRVDFTAAALVAPLRLASKTSWRLDSKRLKTEAPELYVRYAKQSTYWELRAVTERGNS
jgi:hypothetical protein